MSCEALQSMWPYAATSITALLSAIGWLYKQNLIVRNELFKNLEAQASADRARAERLERRYEQRVEASLGKMDSNGR